VSLVTVRVADVALTTPRSRLLVLDLGDHPFEFRPGQAITTGLHGHVDRWPYSIACSPEHSREHRCLELLVSFDHGREISGHPSRATVGTLLDLEGPLGTFTFPARPAQNRLLFVAGGTGIAPLRSMVDHALRSGRAYQISVLYSARRGDEFAFIEELREHERGGRIELFQTVTRDDTSTWSGVRGRIGRSHFEAALHEPGSTLCFVCGPAPLVAESATTLGALGVPPTLIRTEQWGGQTLTSR
jgi:ferredoxin-NADP reductase